jgi:hypothetical protein
VIWICALRMLIPPDRHIMHPTLSEQCKDHQVEPGATSPRGRASPPKGGHPPAPDRPVSSWHHSLTRPRPSKGCQLP